MVSEIPVTPQTQIVGEALPIEVWKAKTEQE